MYIVCVENVFKQPRINDCVGKKRGRHLNWVMLVNATCNPIFSLLLLKGVENVYTQHKPLLTDTLNTLIKGRLSVEQFPFAGEKSYTDRYQCTNTACRDIYTSLLGNVFVQYMYEMFARKYVFHMIHVHL